MKKKLTTLMVMTIIFALSLIPTITISDGDMLGIASEEHTVSISDNDLEMVGSGYVTDVTTLFEDITPVETDSKEELNTLILECDEYIARLMSETEKSYDEENMEKLNNEIARVEELKATYESKVAYIIEQEELAAIEAAKWEQRKTEYPVATKIWLYMKNELGWNDYVCAGVMGNLMAEVGGQTLNIQPELYGHNNRGYYGICQWSSKYYPEVQGKNLDFQLDYLRDTVEYQFNTYGRLYQKGMKYEQFTQMEGDCGQIALCFAKVYERCGSGSYNVRMKNAVKAYEYFTN